MADVVQLGETPEKKADYIKKVCVCVVKIHKLE